jgi:hypothetical protein
MVGSKAYAFTLKKYLKSSLVDDWGFGAANAAGRAVMPRPRMARSFIFWLSRSHLIEDVGESEAVAETRARAELVCTAGVCALT